MKLNKLGPISIESSEIMIGASLREHAFSKIESAISKMFNSMESATVHFKQDGSGFLSTIRVKVGCGNFYADAKGTDCYKAFNTAMDKVEVQLRRAKKSLREDKPVRTDKDAILRDGLREPSYDEM